MDRTAHAAELGDYIVIAGHRLGEPERIVEILEVVGELPHESYRVRWDDGHESLFRPAAMPRSVGRPVDLRRRLSNQLETVL